MALVVEDGSAVTNAESYVSIADASTYHTTWANTAWAAAASDAIREGALRKATRYLDATYGPRWKGHRSTATQALDWPRSWVYTREDYLVAANSVPQQLKDACAEMALKALSEDLMPDLSDTGTVSSESITVGSISSSTTFMGGKSPVKKYRAVDALVSTIVDGPGELIRA